MAKTQDYDLKLLAREIMKSRGLEIAFPAEVFVQLDTINAPAKPEGNCADFTSLLWCSIDNDDSRDLDQLTYAEKGTEGQLTIYIAVADVDALVKKDSPIDLHAQRNTTTVYTPEKIFPMLPVKLSTDLTSLNENEDRVAMVVAIEIGEDGNVESGKIEQGVVRNRAQLTYKKIGKWLAKEGPLPEKAKKVSGLEESLLIQHEAAQKIKRFRHALGALSLESPEVQAKVMEGELLLEMPTFQNYASELIENFMIAANHVMAMHFRKANVPALRRVVRIPKNWDRIVEIAKKLEEKLPLIPDSLALEQFLVKRKKADPEAFFDLSLTVIKLLGRGEYIVEKAGDTPVGHFGLALSEYTHSTAPNRRYPDLISQRQMKAILNGTSSPYSQDELQTLSVHCTAMEDASMKVERQTTKAAEAMFLSSIGETFSGIVTGSSPKGTWVRIFNPPVEGRVIEGMENLQVGDRINVRLVSVDIPKGYINFARDFNVKAS